MRLTVRRLEPGEELAFARSVRVPFLDSGSTRVDEERERRRAARTETARAWVVDDGGHFVGNCMVQTRQLSVPAEPAQPCPLLPMGGVGAVGVHPTHRRRGLLTKMIAEMLADCRSRGEPLAGLIASEAPIYGRFGFGLATEAADYTLEVERSGFSRPAPWLELHLVEAEQAPKVLPPLWEAARTSRPGEPSRPDSYWEALLDPGEGSPYGCRAPFFAACEQGYLSYRPKGHADILAGARAEVVVEEVCAADPGVQAALWRFALDLDLVGKLTFRRRPLDEPVRWRLTDLRRLRTAEIYDRLYLRVLDVPAALEGRGYRSEGRLVLEVLAPDTAEPGDPSVGRWVLEAGPGGASCRRARGGLGADLRMRVTELASVYLGGFRPSLLAAAGLVEELAAGSLEVADRLFASGSLPLTVTGF